MKEFPFLYIPADGPFLHIRWPRIRGFVYGLGDGIDMPLYWTRIKVTMRGKAPLEISRINLLRWHRRQCKAEGRRSEKRHVKGESDETLVLEPAHMGTPSGVAPDRVSAGEDHRPLRLLQVGFRLDEKLPPLSARLSGGNRKKEGCVMKVETITYAQVRSVNYSNQRAEVTVRLEDGDSTEAVFAEAKRLVDKALSGPWLPNPYKAPSPYKDEAGEVTDDGFCPESEDEDEEPDAEIEEDGEAGADGQPVEKTWESPF